MARAGGITNAVNVGIAVQADWENREFISHISLNVRRLFEFLLQFGNFFLFVSSEILVFGILFFLGEDFLLMVITFCMKFLSEATTKSKLASLNEKLDTLERRLEVLEVQVGTATANPSLLST